MKKLILILLPTAIFLAACSEPEPPPPPAKKPAVKAKAKPKSSDNPEAFRAVEKPSSYGQ
jgi:PBP1b-binding outer membrane lipoprotein LpoB